MVITRMISTSLVVLLLTGCATYGQISSIMAEDQKMIYRDGRETVLSQKKHTVAIALQSETIRSGHRANFIIGVRNGGEDDIVFSTGNIAITMSGSKDRAKTNSLKVYSYEDLVKEEKKRQAWAALATAIGAVGDSLSAASAGYSHTYGSYSGSAYSSYGTSAYGHGTYSATTYNPGAAQAAQNAAQTKSAAQFAQIQEEGRATLQALASTILKKQTIFPGEWHGGVVKVRMPRVRKAPTEFVVKINVDGEEHLFQFKQTKAKK